MTEMNKKYKKYSIQNHHHLFNVKIELNAYLDGVLHPNSYTIDQNMQIKFKISNTACSIAKLNLKLI